MPTLIERLSEERTGVVQAVEAATKAAGEDGRDLNENEVEVLQRSKDRIAQIDQQLVLVSESTAMDSKVKERLATLGQPGGDPANTPLLYRSPGAYISDYIAAHASGDHGAKERMTRFQTQLKARAAEHILTSDTPGIVPDPIVGEVVALIDASRPVVTAFGTSPVTAGPIFHRPRLVDPNLDTGVAEQVAQKTELVSKKFSIVRDDVSVKTYGGYVNVSLQETTWGIGAMDAIVRQLARRYARLTENIACDVLEASTNVVDYDSGTATSADFSRAIYGAAGKYYTAMGELPTMVITDPTGWAYMGGLSDAANRPLFPFLAAANSPGQSSASSFAGNPVGLNLVVSYGVTPGTFVVAGPSALELYENLLGSLSVIEPSVLGTQVAYAGFFATYEPNANGAVKIYNAP